MVRVQLLEVIAEPRELDQAGLSGGWFREEVRGFRRATREVDQTLGPTEQLPQSRQARGQGPHARRGVAEERSMAAPVAALLSYWLVPETVFGLDGWRIVVLAGSAGAVVVWFIRRAVPESPSPAIT